MIWTSAVNPFSVEVAFYYRAADLVVLPYRKIYQSGVLLMAMSYQVPVLVSDLPGMLEVVQDEDTGFVFKTGNHQSLQACLLKILEYPRLLAEVSQKASALMRNKYDWANIGLSTKKLYRDLLYIPKPRFKPLSEGLKLAFPRRSCINFPARFTVFLLPISRSSNQCSQTHDEPSSNKATISINRFVEKAFDHDHHRHKDNFYVQHKRPIFDVPQIVVQTFFQFFQIIDFTSITMHLCQAGNPWSDFMSQHIAFPELAKILVMADCVGTRSDNG